MSTRAIIERLSEIRHHPPVAIIERYWRRFLGAIDAYGMGDPIVLERWGEYLLAREMHWYD